MDIETILTYVAYVISIASVLVPALYKVAEITPTNKDDKVVAVFDKILKVAIQVTEALGINSAAKKQEQKAKDKKEKKS